MQRSDYKKFHRVACMMASTIIVVLPGFVFAGAQPNPSAATAAPPVQLQPYTAQDQSVSAGVPSGWKVMSAAGGSINMTGPQGETINFGDVFLAQNGPFHLGQKGPGAALMTMPSTAKLTDKLVMFLQQEQSLAGKPVAQIKYIYATPLQVPANMGQCGMFAADFTGTPTPTKAMGVFCSLPPDSAQLFKLVLLMGTAPSAMAVQTIPTVAAVYNSYKIAPGWAQRMLSPYTMPAAASGGQGAMPPAASAAETQMYLRAMANNQSVIDHGFRCADAGILGNGSMAETPRECGGWAPNF